MTAEELRIGNYVLVKDGTNYEKYIWTVSDISEYGLGLKCEIGGASPELDNVQPIPLTEEILLKCGFEFIENAYLSPLSNLTSRLKIVGYDGNYRFLLNTHMAVKVGCLHQLQNLYFALTGKELEVEL